MSHGLLAENVDTTLAIVYYKTEAVFSEVHDQRASRERRELLTRCLSAVAELLVLTTCTCFYQFVIQLVPALMHSDHIRQYSTVRFCAVSDYR